MADPARTLERALDQAAEALRRGDFTAAGRAAEAATLAEARLHRRPPTEPALARIRARAERLQTLAAAARQGLEDGAARIAALGSGSPLARTYDSNGALTEMGRATARLERRA